MDLTVQGFIGVRWCDVHVKLGGIWVHVAFLGQRRFGCCLQGLRVVLELLEVGHIDGEVRRRLLRYSEGLKRSSYCPRILANGHLKVGSFEAAPHFG
jgi:hypothetical protein